MAFRLKLRSGFSKGSKKANSEPVYPEGYQPFSADGTDLFITSDGETFLVLE